MPGKVHTLSAKERIKSRKQLQQLFTEGKSFVRGGLRVTYSIKAATIPLLKMGVSVPKRKHPHATDRNRIKRLIRETYRVQKHSLLEELQLTGCEVTLFFFYIQTEIPPYNDIYDMMKECLKKMSKEISSVNK